MLGFFTFGKQALRMCNSMENCESCPLNRYIHDDECILSAEPTAELFNKYEELCDIIEDWAVAHPKFVIEDGELWFEPNSIYRLEDVEKFCENNDIKSIAVGRRGDK